MIVDVQNALRAIIGAAPLIANAAGPGRVFELFIMTGIARALQNRSYDVWIRRSDGTRIRPSDTDRRFIQRGGAPTGIPPRAQGAGNASTIVFGRGRAAWEILNGVQFAGRSSGHHEIDLAVIPVSVAEALRSGGSGGVPLGRPRIAIECKSVRATGSVDEMRAFVARLYDLTLLRAHHSHFPNLPAPQAIHPSPPQGALHRPALTYWKENRRTLNIVARRSGFSAGAASLTGYYGVEPHGGITASAANATSLFDDVANWIRRRGY